MSYNLFLDDVRIPKEAFGYMHLPIYISVDWIVVRNYNDFVKQIKENGIPHTISFDHDLAEIHYKKQNFN